MTLGKTFTSLGSVSSLYNGDRGRQGLKELISKIPEILYLHGGCWIVHQIPKIKPTWITENWMDYRELEGQEVSNPSADYKLRFRKWEFQLSIYSFRLAF